MSSQNGRAKNPIAFGFGLIPLFLLAFVPSPARANAPQSTTETPGTFRWIHANSDPQIWEQILEKFNEELTPDRTGPEKDPSDVYTYKFIQKVGLFNHSALVIVGHRPTKELTKDNEWNAAYSAFNFDLATGQKSTIEHADWLWQCKFVKLANFGPTPAPDVTFTYLTCTECEPDIMFSSFYYDAAKAAWQVRSWGNGKEIWWTTSVGLVTEVDIIGDGDLTFFDCVYGILDSQDPRFQNLAMRCKEFRETEPGKSKALDHTVLYSLSDGRFKGRELTNSSEIVELTQQICKPGVSSLLCRLPREGSITAGQKEVLRVLFPNAPPTVRALAAFRSLKPTMAMREIVSKCGMPDELGGSGLYTFSYRLEDGTYINISATGTDVPVFYANHLDADGRGSSLFAEK